MGQPRRRVWVAANVDVPFVENEAVRAYTDLTVAALQKMGQGDFDLTDEVNAILALRDDIAALAPGASIIHETPRILPGY